MKDIIKLLLSETNGTLSMMRLLVAFIILTFLFNWTYIVIKTGTWIALDYGSVIAILGALGAKAFQKKSEENK